MKLSVGVLPRFYRGIVSLDGKSIPQSNVDVYFTFYLAARFHYYGEIALVDLQTLAAVTALFGGINIWK